MNREQLETEIKRVQTAIAKSDSSFLIRDYTKYLKKLRRKIRALEREDV